MSTYLDTILERHRREVALDPRSTDAVFEAASAVRQPTRGFRQALVDATQLAVIAEVKRRSPSKGDLAPGLDPAFLAVEYERGGATCLSVLTDFESFGGSTADLQAARNAVKVPVLRKDFTVSVLDVCDARLMGADCVLLIAAALDDSELALLSTTAQSLGLDVLFEIHDEEELRRVREVGADLIGVNQRDLLTFAVDHDRATRMAPLIGDNTVRVAESGVRNAQDALSLRAVGYDAILVGESLVTQTDPATALRHLICP